MSSRRRRSSLALFATVLSLVGLPFVPAQAATPRPDLTVSITSLTPQQLRSGKSITMTGTVRNNNKTKWEALQAYLVIPASPFTTRAQVEEAVANGNSYTGVRVVDPNTFDDIGDLAPGKTHRFRIKVPYGSLGISGAEGVYPIGVQILGTASDGSRSINAIARATTFLPRIASDRASVPSSVVWPFLMPDSRGTDGNYRAPEDLLKSVGTGGQLRNLLDLARSTPPRSSTVLVDPALLVGVDDLANGRHLPTAMQVSDREAAEADAFLQDLLRFARSESCWVLGFNRPDVLALAEQPDLSSTLSPAIEQATADTLARYQLSGRMVSWPSREGVTSELLNSLRGAGDSPVLVTPTALPDWDRRLGSIVQYDTTRGPVPLFVNDVLDADLPGRSSVVTLRQRILSEATLAVLQRAIDPRSRADAVTMVDPNWNPGPGAANQLSGAFEASFAKGASLDDLLTRRLSTYDGKVPETTSATPLSRTQLEAAADLVAGGEVLGSVIPSTGSTGAAFTRDVADLLAVHWRREPGIAIAIARARVRRTTAELSRISIEGPPSVTLSSSQGGFPLTIDNDSDSDILIGVSLDSSNPALQIPGVEPVEIGAGERRTLTVNIDLANQSTTTLTARLVSSSGQVIGEPDQFNVRTSKVGAVLWVAMSLSGLLVLAALVRRFRRSRALPESERLVDDD